MNTELLEPETDNRLSRFRQQDAAIAKMKAEYSLLTVKDVNDARGLKLVHAARMEVKNCRVAVEKLRKELKADSLEYGRKVDAEAKRITAMIEPIETHLEEQEAIVTREKERLKAEAEAKRKAILDERISKLLAVGCVLNPQIVEVMTAEKFAETLDTATKAKAEADSLAAEKLAAEEAEKKRQAEEAARNRAELEAQRKALAEERAKHEAEAATERAKLAAERKAIELENARREAAEKAKRETEERIAREAEAVRLAEEAEAARFAKLEAERPHREKMLAIAEHLDSIEVDAGPFAQRVVMLLGATADEIRAIVDSEQLRDSKGKR